MSLVIEDADLKAKTELEAKKKRKLFYIGYILGYFQKKRPSLNKKKVRMHLIRLVYFELICLEKQAKLDEENRKKRKYIITSLIIDLFTEEEADRLKLEEENRKKRK
jgi:hypothetical protein